MDQAIVGNYCVLAVVLLTFLTVAFMWLDLRRTDSEILRHLDGRAPGEPVPSPPRYPPLQPGQCAAEARAYYEAHVAPQDRPAPGRATPSARMNWAKVGGRQSDEGSVGPTTPRSPRDYVTGWYSAVDEDGTPLVTPRDLVAIERAPALGEDEERPWEKQSGTWRRET